MRVDRRAVLYLRLHDDPSRVPRRHLLPPGSTPRREGPGGPDEQRARRLRTARPEGDDRVDRTRWPDYKQKITDVFKSRTREQWCEIMEGSDVCFAPVLSLTEAAEHPHNKHRRTFTELDGVLQPAPAPRFSRTEPALTHSSRHPGEDTVEVLKAAGIEESSINEMLQSGAISTVTG